LGASKNPPYQADFLFPALSSPWRGSKAETQVRTSLGALLASGVLKVIKMVWSG
jgi:hypothetical protein